MALGVFWDGELVGHLVREGDRSRDYRFEYTNRSRPISLSLPVDREGFTPAETRPFFEALLPEGAVRDQIAAQFKLVPSDSYGLLAELGRDCAGALQIVAERRMSDSPSVRWLTEPEFGDLIEDLPRHPFGVRPEDGRLRLSLVGVQRKAVLVRAEAGEFGEPLDGMPSTHILKPDLPGSDYPGLATNEFFCMRLADRCGLSAAKVELIVVAGRPCVVVERFDRDRSSSPPARLHQEDLCQALGLTPDFKYQHPGEAVPSYRALAELLDEHSNRPGVDRLEVARAAVFNFMVGNADAHAKNISLLHSDDGVALAPLYDLVSTAAYPELTHTLSLAIGDEFDPDRVGPTEWRDLAVDLGLQPRAFERERKRLAGVIVHSARTLRSEALGGGWHRETVDAIVKTVESRAPSICS
jgi:serine/threonine-protein kinase HipA